MNNLLRMSGREFLQKRERNMRENQTNGRLRKKMESIMLEKKHQVQHHPLLHPPTQHPLQHQHQKRKQVNIKDVKMLLFKQNTVFLNLSKKFRFV